MLKRGTRVKLIGHPYTGTVVKHDWIYNLVCWDTKEIDDLMTTTDPEFGKVGACVDKNLEVIENGAV